MEKFHKITLNAKSNLFVDKAFHWQGEVTEGDLLEDLLDTLAEKYEYFREGVYNREMKRLFPYHLLIINGTLILPEKISRYRIAEDLDIKINPFVSGG